MLLLTYDKNIVQYICHMKANPGGTIGPNDVIGRDDFIKRLWRNLESQSLVLTSERRIGKTSVIRKMKEEQSGSGVVCVLRDLEGLRTPKEFVEGLYQDVDEFLPRGDRAALKLNRLLSRLGGAQIGSIKLPEFEQHWKDLLSALVEDLVDTGNRIAVFFWDELPLFVHNIRQASGEALAMEFLDVLRSLRQRHTRVRMVFTGSVGLHQVIKALRGSKGYANDPTNDMLTVEVPPLSANDGAHLAALLIDGEEIEIEGDRRAVARGISDATGRIPFYIHSVIARLKAEGAVGCLETGREYVKKLIADPDDPAHFRYYRERLGTYYDDTEEAVALAALDALAVAPQGSAFAELLKLVRHKIAAEEELLRDTLHLLARDHYVLQNPQDGAYHFRYEIVRRWWQFSRG
jgi:hypothetical protein